MRLLITTALLAVFMSATPAPSQDREVRHSAFVADVDTGLILTADRIDSPRKPDLLGRFTIVGLTAQDIANGALDPTEMLRMGRWQISIWDGTVTTAQGGDGWRGAMTALVNRLGATPSGVMDLVDAAIAQSGLQATRMRIVRDADGGPGFAGYTTPRDMGRMITAFLRAHETVLTQIFAAELDRFPTTRAWMADKGMCMLAAHGPRTQRLMVAVLTGADDDESCLETGAELIRRDDARIAAAIRTDGD